MFELVRHGWGQALCAVLGLWLMAAPVVLGYGESLGAVHRIVGPIAAAVAIVALWGHMRPLRWLHLPLGALVISGSVVAGGAVVGLTNGVLTGLLMIGLGVVRGTVVEHYGGGWSSLWTGGILPGSTDRTDR